MHVCRNIVLTLLICCCSGLPSAIGQTRWTAVDGTTTFTPNYVALRENGVRLEPIGMPVSTVASNGNIVLQVGEFSALSTSRLNPAASFVESTQVIHNAGLTLKGPRGEAAFPVFEIAQPDGTSHFQVAAADGTTLTFPGLRTAWKLDTQTLTVRAPDVVVSEALARAIGAPGLAGHSIGRLESSLTLAYAGEAPTDGEEEPIDVVYDIGDPRGGPTWSCGGNPGPDVIVGDLVGDVGNSAFQVTAVNVGGVFIDAFSVGTTSCNVGTSPLSWIDEGGSNAHPVIGQNFFRLSNGRFEHIGQSWLKHGFFALQGNICCTSCSPQNGDIALGVGCSDPYSAFRNAGQAGAGPKHQVNPTTGVHIHPVASPSFSGSVARRLQVHLSDLQDPTAQYFVEGQYVTADDAAAGNQNNNASYRRVNVTGAGNDRTFTLMGTTQRAQAGIRAWRDADPTVTETDVQVDGLYIVAVKATDLGDGFYHYEYAVQNLNSHRAADSFSIPVANAGTVRNIGFHDVAYHSNDGEGNVTRDGTDWVGDYANGSVTWNMVDVGANSNALRWGTLYNFRFDANVLPATVMGELSLFAAGSPASVTFSTQGPGGNLITLDCNGNGIDDPIDIANMTSADCNGNNLPDECEDACELTSVRVAVGDQPSFVCAPPGDLNRLFITELPGRIRILNLINGSLLPNLFLDLTTLVRPGGEDGLFSMAFHPEYATNGKFYVNYTTLQNPRRTRIVQYTVSGDPNVADPNSAVILFEIAQPFSNHNGGQLQFGPDGMLYCAMGDGGSQNDPGNRSQDDTSYFGKLLRFDVDNPPTYLPSDNPGGSWLPEVWAKGLRNPWRFSFDRLTGDMYLGDVGQSIWEEINFQPADSTGGENYGWRCYEGNNPHITTGCGPIGDYTFPIHTVNHSDSGTISITGGYVYRGCAIPGLSGTYFFADYGGDYIRTFRYDGSTLSQLQDRTAQLQPNLGSLNAIVSFGEDGAGELYIVCQTGGIFRIECVDTSPNDCGNNILEPGEECENPDGVNCNCDCQIVDEGCTPSFSDNFETNMGWSVGSTTASAGAWQRGVPVACNSRGAPPTDFDGSGQCYLTANNTGTGGNCDSDVDGTAGNTGTVTLASPMINMSQGGQVRYAYWLMDTPGGEIGPGDGLFVEVSLNGGGNWTQVRAYTTAVNQWRTDTILVGGSSGEVAPSANFRIRFHARDAQPGDVIEAGIDAVIACTVTGTVDCNLNCTPDSQDIAELISFDCNANGVPDECEVGVPSCDCNGNAIPDAIDIANETSADCNENGLPDECDLALNPALDCDGGPVGNATAGELLFSLNCVFCHGTEGLGGEGDGTPCGGVCPGANIRNHSRREIWTMLLPPTNHPGGAHPEFTQQNFADLEAFLADEGSRGRPDMVPDSCQELADCDGDLSSDGCELEAGTQVDADYDGIPDACNAPCGTADGDMNEDTLVDGQDLTLFVTGLLGTPSAAEICHGDFSGNAALDNADVEDFVNALLNQP